MPRSSNQKLKPLYLARILLERTDENNVLTAQELITALNAYGIEAGRKTVYDDIEALRQFGFDIVVYAKEKTAVITSCRGILSFPNSNCSLTLCSPPDSSQAKRARN